MSKTGHSKRVSECIQYYSAKQWNKTATVVDKIIVTSIELFQGITGQEVPVTSVLKSAVTLLREWNAA